MSAIRRLGGIPPPLIFVASLLVAVVLLWRQDALTDLVPILRQSNGKEIAAGFLLYLFSLVLLCVRWDALVRMVRGWSNLPRAAEAFLTSVVINYAAPISLAIPSRAALTKKQLGLSGVQTGAAAFWEVMVDVGVLFVGSCLWILMAGWRPTEVSVTFGNRVIWLAGLLIVCILALGLSLLVLRRRPELRERIQQTARTSLSYPVEHRGRFAFVTLLTILFWTVQGGVIWLLLQAVGVDNPGSGLILGLTTVPMLIGMLSPVPGGAGVREAFMVGIGNIYDTDAAAIALVAITYRLALFAAIPVLYLLVHMWRRFQPDSLPVSGVIPESD